MDDKIKSLHDQADRLEAEAETIREHAYRLKREEDLKSPLGERLVYAAYARCHTCHAGMAYDPTGEVDPYKHTPFRSPHAWDCSAVLLGEKKAGPEHDHLPFAFWEVKSERQPSVGGATTRPPKE